MPRPVRLVAGLIPLVFGLFLAGRNASWRASVAVAAAVAGLTALSGLACGTADRDSSAVATLDTLPNGILLVRNRPPPDRFDPDRAPLVDEDLRIGAIDGEDAAVFGDIRGLLADESGNVYVLEHQSKEIRVFDAAGAHLRTFGRAGEGPGELVHPNGMVWGPDESIWVADPDAGRYSVFSTAGELVDSHRIDFPIHGYLWHGVFGPNRRLHDRSMIYRLETELRKEILRRIDFGSGRVDTLPLPEPPPGLEPAVFAVMGKSGGMTMDIPFGARFRWRLDGRGHVWSGLTNEYRIVKQDVSGDTVLLLVSEVDPVEVTDEEREEAISFARSAFERFGGADLDFSRIPATKPAFENLSFDDAGNLWVQLTPEVGSEGGRYDVYGQDGRWLASVRISFRIAEFRTPLVRDGQIYGVVQDELGVSYVVRGELGATGERLEMGMMSAGDRSGRR